MLARSVAPSTYKRPIAIACAVVTLAVCTGDARAQIPSAITEKAAEAVDVGGDKALRWVLIAMCVWLGYRERAARGELSQLTKDSQSLALQTVTAIADIKSQVQRLADKQ